MPRFLANIYTLEFYNSTTMKYGVNLNSKVANREDGRELRKAIVPGIGPFVSVGIFGGTAGRLFQQSVP